MIHVGLLRGRMGLEFEGRIAALNLGFACLEVFWNGLVCIGDEKFS